MSEEPDFYRAFEDRFRGPRGVIKSRLRVYLPFIDCIRERGDECSAVDLGCGRGEWLELLKEAEVQGHGIDLDDGMLAACREAEVLAIQGDAISAIQGLPDESHDIVSAFHLVEHIPFSSLHVLVQEALRVLRSGGLLILETPNPENIFVGTSQFYLDPTHKRPIPPALLAFLPEYYGYQRTKVLRLQETIHLIPGRVPSLLNVIRDSSPDYAVIAQKFGPDIESPAWKALFEKEYGLTVGSLAEAYDEAVVARIQGAEARANNAEILARQAHEAVLEATRNAQVLLRDKSSRSSSITAAIRDSLRRLWRWTSR
jgi:O-antigen chain-terminating methyltransferase